jgi:aspartate aminotransferase
MNASNPIDGIAFSQRLTDLTASETGATREKVSALRKAGRKVFDLTAGDVKVPMPEPMMRCALRSLAEDGNGYCSGLGIASLKELLAQRLLEADGIHSKAENIAVVAGAKAALFAVACCILQEGDEVIIPAPYWTTFPAQVRMLNARPIFVAANGPGSRWDADRIIENISDRTKCIILNSPNNPAGLVYDGESIERIYQHAHRRGIWVILDEAYHGLWLTASQFAAPLTSHLFGKDSRLIRIRSFSKTHALAGWRLGFLVAPRNLIDRLAIVISHTTSNANSLAQHVLIRYLSDHDLHPLPEVLTHLRQNSECVNRVLASTLALSWTSPQAGLFVYLRLKDEFRRTPSANTLGPSILEDVGVAGVDGSAFGEGGSLRISLGGAMQELAEGASMLASWMPR